MCKVRVPPPPIKLTSMSSINFKVKDQQSPRETLTDSKCRSQRLKLDYKWLQLLFVNVGLNTLMLPGSVYKSAAFNQLYNQVFLFSKKSTWSKHVLSQDICLKTKHFLQSKQEIIYMAMYELRHQQSLCEAHIDVIICFVLLPSLVHISTCTIDTCNVSNIHSELL